MIGKQMRGFTILELLVVLAIIGMLAIIVFVSINGGRAGARDAKVKAQMTEIRKAANNYYDSKGNYGASSMATPANQCTGSMFTDVASRMHELTGKSDTWPFGTTLSCQATNASYAVTASLTAANAALIPLASNYWCVDSSGVSKAVPAHLLSGVVVCP